MTTVLISGGTGFAGSYLARRLHAWGADVHVTAHGESRSDVRDTIGCHPVDIKNQEAVFDLVKRLRPDHIYHLAGVTRPGDESTEDFYDINVGGARALLAAAHAHAPQAKVLLVGSAYAYASSRDAIDETWPLEPTTHYGASKVAAEAIGRAYVSDGLHVAFARPFNHSGPGQPADFVLPRLVNELTDAKATGAEKHRLEMGNVDAVRDISDVRDVVEAYVTILRDGDANTAYNVGSGVGRSIRELVEVTAATIGIEVDLRVDERRLRASDVDALVANIDRLSDLGWAPTYNLETTIDAMSAHRREAGSPW